MIFVLMMRPWRMEEKHMEKALGEKKSRNRKAVCRPLVTKARTTREVDDND